MNNSFWWESLPKWESLPPLDQALEVDVAIIGAGYTGLWSAFFLKRAQPHLNLVILEAEHLGFGASGRNGGWVSSLWPTSFEKSIEQSGINATFEFQKFLHQIVDEFGQTLIEENIEADYVKAGTVNLARSQSQLDRLSSETSKMHQIGFKDADYLLTTELSKLPRATSVHGGLISPHCASIHPAKLVRGLAAAVIRLGVEIFENSPVQQIKPGLLSANGKKVKAKYLLIATEGYRHQLLPRTTAPIHSLMFISDPIPNELLDQLNLTPGITFNDARNLIIYGQRTKDNRIAFGGRGAPYRLRSKTGNAVEFYQPAFDYLKRSLGEMFPQISEYIQRPSHTWGGPIGVSRDWQPSITFDKNSGVISAGNYVGDGVAAAYLAGKTIADLIGEQSTYRTSLSWVNHKSPKWEIEPLRYLLINAARIGIDWADKLESSAGKQTLFSKLLWQVLKR